MYTDKATWLYFIYLNQMSVPVDKAVSRRRLTAKARHQRKSVIVGLSHHWRATGFRRRHGATGHRCWEAAASADETTSCRPDSLVIMNKASYCWPVRPLRTVRPVRCPYIRAGVDGVTGALNNYTHHNNVVFTAKKYD